MGHEYPSDNQGDGHHASEEYDPENDANRKRKHQQKKAQQKYRKKRRRNTDARSKEYEGLPRAVVRVKSIVFVVEMYNV